MSKTNTALPELSVFRLVREFNVPIDLVWQSWSDPRHLKGWWGPVGSKMIYSDQDLREAGVFHYCSETQSGGAVWGKCTYLAIEEPNRLDFVVAFSDALGGTVRHPQCHDWPLEFVLSAEFIERGNRTLLVMEAWPINAAEEEIVAFTAGHIAMEHAFGDAFDQLETSLKNGQRLSQKEKSMIETKINKLVVTTPSDFEFVLSREFSAPRELVWDAVTKPEHVRKWWGCENSEMTTCELDFRVGGSYRFVLAMDDGECPMTGVYQEIVHPERIVHTEIYDVEPYRNFPSLVTVRFEDLGGRTAYSATVRHQSKEMRDGHLNSGVEHGAGQSLDRLEALLESLS
jgi:uncharacterized protein YndB with AHSA1/START domain